MRLKKKKNNSLLCFGFGQNGLCSFIRFRFYLLLNLCEIRVALASISYFYRIILILDILWVGGWNDVVDYGSCMI